MNEVKEAGTHKRPRQGIAELPNGALAPQKSLSAFMILFLGNAALNPLGRCCLGRLGCRLPQHFRCFMTLFLEIDPVE